MLIWTVITAYLLLAWNQRWKFPLFALYSGVMAVYLSFWDPYNAPRLVAWEPIVLSLRVGVVVELFCRAVVALPVSERRWLLALVVMIAVTIVGIPFAFGYYALTTPMEIYHAIRHYFHLLLAGCCLFGVTCMWVCPPDLAPMVKPHGFILTAYFANHAVIGLIKFGKGELAQWKVANAAYFSVVLVCIALWIWATRERTQPVYPLRQVGDGIA